MSRTPKADVSKLPIWARCMITDLEDRLALVTEERDEALGWCDNLEWYLEALTKQFEEWSNRKHEDTPNTICADRLCCPLPLATDGVQRPLPNSGA